MSGPNLAARTIAPIFPNGMMRDGRSIFFGDARAKRRLWSRLIDPEADVVRMDLLGQRIFGLRSRSSIQRIYPLFQDVFGSAADKRHGFSIERCDKVELGSLGFKNAGEFSILQLCHGGEIFITERDRSFELSIGVGIQFDGEFI